MNLPEDTVNSPSNNTISTTEEQESESEMLENEDQFTIESEMEQITPETNNVNPNQDNTFTISEVSTHNSKNDCYLIIRDNVYDVSSFIDSHPGGTQKISEKCGQEVSGIFAQIHSNKAWDLLIDYKIGTITN